MTQAIIKTELAAQVATLSPPYVASTTQDAMALALYNSLQKGVTDGSAGAAGDVGQYAESYQSYISTVVTITAKTITSLTLTAGDWDVSLISKDYLTSGTGTFYLCGISLTDNVRATVQYEGAAGLLHTNAGAAVSFRRLSVAATTTVYAVCFASFGTAGALRADALLYARRVR